MKFNIIPYVVEKDKCIGCGLCDAICPVNVLTMEFNNKGHLQPFETDGCLDKCTLCINVCPFIEENEDEKIIAKNLYSNIENINFHKDLGYFLNTYEMYNKRDEERLQSASGGAGYWLLSKLLKTKEVDSVITVESQENTDKLFKFSVFNDTEDLINTRGSAYYPTDLAEVIDYILKNDGKYAITVLPCYAKAIRLAQKKNSKLRKRIKYLIGLVCGQQKTKYFTEELGKIALGDKKIQKIQYRIKQANKPSSDYAFKFTDIEGNSSLLTWSEKPTIYWTNRMFTPNACNYCTDVFALDTDIVLMDAWLPEYIKDYKGHTFIISRTKEIEYLLQSDSNTFIEKIDYNKVFKSQERVVVSKNNYFYGSKNPLTNQIVKYRKKIQKLSNEDFRKNQKTIHALLKKVSNIERIKRLPTYPLRLIKRILKKIKGSIK